MRKYKDPEAGLSLACLRNKEVFVAGTEWGSGRALGAGAREGMMLAYVGLLGQEGLLGF